MKRKQTKQNKTNTFVTFCRNASADPTLCQERRSVLRQLQQGFFFFCGEAPRTCSFQRRQHMPADLPREQAASNTTAKMCLGCRKWQHGEKSVHTHQHMSRAVNRMQDGEREKHSKSPCLSAIHSLLLYILYCSITLCHTCCLYDYHCTQRRNYVL